jgi:hypothetical protein
MTRLPRLALAALTLTALTASGLPSWAQTTPDANAARIKEHMEVVGVDGRHVGTVDAVKGDTIALTKNDPAAQGQHHAIPVAGVGAVDGRVTLTKSADEAFSQWNPASRPGGDRTK